MRVQIGDCPHKDSVQIQNCCDPYCPDLARLFRRRDDRPCCSPPGRSPAIAPPREPFRGSIKQGFPTVKAAENARARFGEMLPRLRALTGQDTRPWSLVRWQPAGQGHKPRRTNLPDCRDRGPPGCRRGSVWRAGELVL